MKMLSSAAAFVDLFSISTTIFHKYQAKEEETQSSYIQKYNLVNETSLFPILKYMYKSWWKQFFHLIENNEEKQKILTVKLTALM